jgi:NAD(P)-dependent dehydrogenase (short-subunit alcohol dehydrogenase family)
MSTLQGQTAIVTGAGSGIGRATAVAFAREGANVVLADMNSASTERVASQATGGATHIHELDLTDRSAIPGLFDATIEAFGRVDHLANVAGIYPGADTTETTDEMWDRVIATNLTAVFLTCREALKRMYEQGSGSIVNIASGAAFKGLAGLTAYTASKGGLVAMSRVMAVESARRGVRVNVVAPGHTASETLLQTRSEAELRAAEQALVPGRRMQPEEIAEAIVYLCSPAASGISGAILNVNGADYQPTG